MNWDKDYRWSLYERLAKEHGFAAIVVILVVMLPIVVLWYLADYFPRFRR